DVALVDFAVQLALVYLLDCGLEVRLVLEHLKIQLGRIELEDDVTLLYVSPVRHNRCYSEPINRSWGHSNRKRFRGLKLAKRVDLQREACWLERSQQWQQSRITMRPRLSRRVDHKRHGNKRDRGERNFFVRGAGLLHWFASMCLCVIRGDAFTGTQSFHNGDVTSV